MGEGHYNVPKYVGSSKLLYLVNIGYFSKRSACLLRRIESAQISGVSGTGSRARHSSLLVMMLWLFEAAFKDVLGLGTQSVKFTTNVGFQGTAKAILRRV